jgi:polyferredoxin
MNPNLQENLSVIQAIQLILAPGVMINACGLLLLGINNKFTSVLNRIRTLTEEKRKFNISALERDLSSIEKRRMESVMRQVNGLLKRAQLIRNTIFCYLSAIGLFVLTSLLIGIDFFVPAVQLRFTIIGSFLGGMIVVFIAVIFGVLDILKGFKIVEYEAEMNK